MFFLEPLSISKLFIGQLEESLAALSAPTLSRTQKYWLSFCITGILITNSVCWRKFERACFGRNRAAKTSAMFRRSKFCWDKLLKASILLIIKQYGITSGMLALDGTDNRRSKNTKHIAKAHKIKDKSSGGFINGQALTFLVLVSNKVSIPVGFEFYEPDPEYIAWRKNDRRLRQQGISKKHRPKQPKKNLEYPSTIEIAVKTLKRFQEDFPEIKVQAILADALYGAKSFFNPVMQIYPGVQIVSQIKSNQKVRSRGKLISVTEYFRRNPTITQQLKIRGGNEQTVKIHGARLHLHAHGCKRFIIALSYEGESEHRYLVASNLTWRLTDIAGAYTFRWLVEVFIQDWKGYEGWCQLAKQPGFEGSRRGVILSLLTDHMLLLHPAQLASVNNKLPAATVGSLRDRERAQAMLDAIEVLLTENQQSATVVVGLRDCVNDAVPLRNSKKHMNLSNIDDFGPAESLKYMAAA